MIYQSNTQYNMKYILFSFGGLRGTLCRFAQINHDLTTQLSMCRHISKMTDQWWPVNSKMHYVVLTATSNGCLKSVSQSIRINIFSFCVCYVGNNYWSKYCSRYGKKKKIWLWSGNTGNQTVVTVWVNWFICLYTLQCFSWLKIWLCARTAFAHLVCMTIGEEGKPIEMPCYKSSSIQIDICLH